MTFIPVWVGLLVWLIAWAVLSIRRVTRGRDDEFTKWLQEQKTTFHSWVNNEQDRMHANFEAKFLQMSSDVMALRENNREAIRHFHQEFERRLAAVEEAVSKGQA